MPDEIIETALPDSVEIIALHHKNWHSIAYVCERTEDSTDFDACTSLHTLPGTRKSLERWYASLTESQRQVVELAQPDVAAFNDLTQEAEALLDTIRPQLRAIYAKRDTHAARLGALLGSVVKDTDHEALRRFEQRNEAERRARQDAERERRSEAIKRGRERKAARTT
jgi:hypothetical protein